MTADVVDAPSTEVITDADRFRDLEDEWRQLYEASPSATPFQTWDWLYTWWEVYGSPGALRLITARHDGRLVGVLPLMVGGPGHLRFIGTGLSDHLDLLVDATVADDVLTMWAHDLVRTSRVRLLDLHEVRPGAVAWQLYGRWPGRRSHHAQSTCAEFDVEPLDDLIGTWSKNTRKSARSAMNRLSKGGYTEHWARPDEIGGLAVELVANHRREWEGSDIAPAHADPRFTRFVRVFAERMARHDQVSLVRLVPPADEPDPMLFCGLMVVGRQYVGGWLGFSNERARRHLSIAILEAILGVKAAVSSGAPVVSLLRGLEDGKLRVHDRLEVNHRLLLAGRGPRAAATWFAASAPAAAKARLKQWERHSAAGRRITTLLRGVRDRFGA